MAGAYSEVPDWTLKAHPCSGQYSLLPKSTPSLIFGITF